MQKRVKLCINLVVTLIFLVILPSVSALTYTPNLSYSSSEINYSSAYSIMQQLNITYFNTTHQYEFSLTAAMLTNNNDDRLDKYQYLDSETKSLDKNKILNLTFNGTLTNGDLISFKLENNKAAEVHLCAPSATCTYPGLGNTTTTSEGFYQIPIFNLTNATNHFSFHTDKKFDLNHINATHFVMVPNSSASYYYLAEAQITTENIQPSDFGSWSSISFNETLNNQLIVYQYSTDNGSSWINLTGTNLSLITNNQLKFKIILYSDGAETPQLNSFQVDYNVVQNLTNETSETNETVEVNETINETEGINETSEVNETSIINETINVTSETNETSNISGVLNAESSQNIQNKHGPTAGQRLERAIRSLPLLPSVPASIIYQVISAPTPTPTPATSPLTGSAVINTQKSPTGSSILDQTSLERIIPNKWASITILGTIILAINVYLMQMRKSLAIKLKKKRIINRIKEAI
ncbi:MAG: hypothetical protein Q8R00_00260 [Candidatus Nanoarchaeia archaeon]|nr:hypothetical protein [Candidatus Nanoarchaeia archaeon]